MKDLKLEARQFRDLYKMPSVMETLASPSAGISLRADGRSAFAALAMYREMRMTFWLANSSQEVKRITGAGHAV
jgi:hypothetical protein